MTNDPKTFDEKLREIIIEEFKTPNDPFLILETLLSSMMFQSVQAVNKFLPTRKIRKQKLQFVLHAAEEQWDKQNAPKLTIVQPTPPNTNEQN